MGVTDTSIKPSPPFGPTEDQEEDKKLTLSSVWRATLEYRENLFPAVSLADVSHQAQVGSNKGDAAAATASASAREKVPLSAMVSLLFICERTLGRPKLFPLAAASQFVF